MNQGQLGLFNMDGISMTLTCFLRYVEGLIDVTLFEIWNCILGVMNSGYKMLQDKFACIYIYIHIYIIYI